MQPMVDDMRLCRADDILDLTSYSRFGRMIYKATALIDPSQTWGGVFVLRVDQILTCFANAAFGKEGECVNYKTIVGSDSIVTPHPPLTVL